MKKFVKRIALTAALATATICSGVTLAACGDDNTVIGRINAPESLQAELGAYVSPEYEVVDDNGMVLQGYTVYLKSVTDSDGNSLQIVYDTVTVETKGIYTFVYSAGVRGVEDASVKIDFADRVAPTISFDAQKLPEFYITGNSYKIPSYTLSGDFVRDKCWTKVFYKSGEGAEETEVDIVSNRFKVDKTSGTYSIRIHVEDAAGNANDYSFPRDVDPPKNAVPHKIVYFDDAYCEKQVACNESSYIGKFVSKDEAGAKVYGDENGAYKVSFVGVETAHNEGYVTVKTPAVIDIRNYSAIELYVYWDYDGKWADPSEDAPDEPASSHFGTTWWNDTAVKNKEWTKISFSTEEWGNVVNGTESIETDDISGFVLRFMFQWGKHVPVGDFYLSAMYGVPYAEIDVKLDGTVAQNISVSAPSNGVAYRENETVTLSVAKMPDGKRFAYFTANGTPIEGSEYRLGKENVVFGAVFTDPCTVTVADGVSIKDRKPTVSGGKVYELARGESVTLEYTGTPPSGKYFDCFTVGGATINGDTLITSGETMTIGVKFFAEASEMTWTIRNSDNTVVASALELINKQKYGDDENWVLQYTFGAIEWGDWGYSISVYIGGTCQIIQLTYDPQGVRKAWAYGEDYEPIAEMSAEMWDVILGATDEKPVTLSFVRKGNAVQVFIECDGVTIKAATLDMTAYYGKASATNEFGYADRTIGGYYKAPTFVENGIRTVTGEAKVNAFIESIGKITLIGEKVTFDKTEYSFGDTVRLIADPAAQGYKFKCFKVDGEEIDGDSFVIVKSRHTVVAEYAEICTVTVADGVTIKDHKPVTSGGNVYELARGAEITLEYSGTPESGKYFDCFTVGGAIVNGDTLTTAGETMTVGVKYFTTASDMTWTTRNADNTVVASSLELINKQKYGDDEDWVLQYTYGAVERGAWGYCIAIYVGGTSQIVQLTDPQGSYFAWSYGEDYEPKVEISADIWRVITGATAAKPVTLSFVRNGNDIHIFAECGGDVFKVATLDMATYYGKSSATNEFGYADRIIGNYYTKPTFVENGIRTVTGKAKVDAFLKAIDKITITSEKIKFDKSEYAYGDTVRLTAETAETGYKFKCFKVDGVTIDGDSFVIVKNNYTVEAVYSRYSIDVTTPLSTVVYSNGLLTLPTYTVKDASDNAVSDVVAVVTVTDEKGNAYIVTDGKAAITYKGAIKLTAKYIVDGDPESEESITFFAQDAEVLLSANALGASLVEANASASVSYDTEHHHGDDGGSIEITATADNGLQDYAYFKFDVLDYDYLEFYAYTDAAGMQIGAWWYGDTDLTQGEWTKITLDLRNKDGNMENYKDGKWIFRIMNIPVGTSVYISTVTVHKKTA